MKPCCKSPEYVRYVQILTWNTAELKDGKLEISYEDSGYGDEVEESAYFVCECCGQKFDE